MSHDLAGHFAYKNTTDKDTQELVCKGKENHEG